MRPAVMPARFSEALEAVGEYVDRAGTAADRATYQSVVDLHDTILEWCDRLAVAPGVPSLDHNDLHPWNILVSGSGATIQARFYDWGDSVVAHPFASMLIGLGFVKERLKAGVNDPRILRVRDAYLEVFDHVAPRADLVEALELACRVGKVARTLTWARAVMVSGGNADAEFQRAPLESLGSLLDDSYLGRV
jgi:aminoglycoside phosphotransferase (APT) family kinase protein